MGTRFGAEMRGAQDTGSEVNEVETNVLLIRPLGETRKGRSVDTGNPQMSGFEVVARNYDKFPVRPKV